MATSQEKVNEIIELHVAGKTSRKIANLIGGSIGKSTVNDIIKRWKEGDTE